MKIKSIEDLKIIIDDIQTQMGLSGRVDYAEFYRGQSSNTYKLENGLTRFKYSFNRLERKEKKLFNKFIAKVKKGNIDFIQNPYRNDKYPFLEEWFYHFQSQHIGLKTRLMDWSNNWEIALMFAVNEIKHFGTDGQFWVFICPRKNIINEPQLDKIYSQHPLEIVDSYMINNPFYQDIEGKEYIAEKRRSRQSGRFFTQPLKKSIVPLEEQNEFKGHLKKFIIDGNSKERIVKELGAITNDWAYFRHDENIDKKIKKLNLIVTKKYYFGF